MAPFLINFLRRKIMTRPRNPERTTYLDMMESKLGLSELAPSELHEELPPISGLEYGPTRSTLGGRVVKDLKHLSPGEFAVRAEEAEEFLKREPVEYPADEAANSSPQET